MSITIDSLEKTSFETIHDTFKEAFADYQIDISYMTLEVMTQRFIKNGFRPELSVGAFDKGKLMGFTIVGTGTFKNNQAAYDIMTGLVKDYRGIGLANKMFDLIKTKMKTQAIKTFYLEVLQENEPAIKAYEKTGFRKARKFTCYSLNLANLKQAKHIQTIVYIDRAEKPELDSFIKSLDWEPSWENHFESIKRIPDQIDIFVARSLNKNIGLLVYYPTINWILSLVVDPAYRNKGVASALLEYLISNISPEIEKIHLINVQEDDIGMKNFLIKSGFKEYTRQFEMQYELSE